MHRYLVPRYLLPYFRHHDADEGMSAEISKDGQVFNPGFEALAIRFRDAGILFFIWLHPETTEVERGAYNSEGKEILAFCNRDSIPVIEGLKYMQPEDYRDGIHLNEQGQQELSAHFGTYLKKYLSKYK
ncbi:MAG: hypothetical protein LUD46_15715 [Parabacteroides sp.]|nr:hypothetical protein [Parabacteroides sp.]